MTLREVRLASIAGVISSVVLEVSVAGSPSRLAPRRVVPIAIEMPTSPSFAPRSFPYSLSPIIPVPPFLLPILIAAVRLVLARFPGQFCLTLGTQSDFDQRFLPLPRFFIHKGKLERAQFWHPSPSLRPFPTSLVDIVPCLAVSERGRRGSRRRGNIVVLP